MGIRLPGCPGVREKEQIMAGEQRPADPNLVQCEITKQWLPADEIIEIEGHKVCSAGKEILLQRLKSGEALPGEMERPTVLRRFCCLFLDGIILAVPMIIVEVATGTFIRFPRPQPPAMATLAIISLVGTALTLVYFGTMHGLNRGQSLGKMAGKIRVVNLDGTPITMSKSYLRAVWYSGPSILAPVPLFVGFQLGANLLTWISGIYQITNIIMALADSNMQRALHDRLAGTRVIKIN
jgi:uncharacterized RDD family membrane protein YckC